MYGEILRKAGKHMISLHYSICRNVYSVLYEYELKSNMSYKIKISFWSNLDQGPVSI